HWAALCQCPRLFRAREHRCPRAPAGSVGTAHPLYPPWGRVAGGAPGSPPRRSPLHLFPSLVGRGDRDSALTIGISGEAGGIGAPAPRPSGALWGLSSAPQPPAPCDHAHPASAGDGRGGDTEGHPVLDVGQAPEARVCPGDGHVSVVSA